MFYRPKASFIQQLSCNLDVNGVAICDHRIFLTGISSQALEVFDANSYLLLQTLAVQGMTDPWDIAARPSNPYLYVFEGLYQILRLDLNGKIVTSWTLDGSQRSLSVSRRNSVVVTYSDRLEEFDNVGKILRSIKLDKAIYNASHSVILGTDIFLVCHELGQRSDSHQLCLVDSDSRIVVRHNGPSGSIYQPVHLAVADHACVLVADIHNRRVQIFADNLSHSYDLFSSRHFWPLRVSYDRPRGNAYITTLDGKVLVYCVRARNSPYTECLNVHSGLITGQLTDMHCDALDATTTSEMEE